MSIKLKKQSLQFETCITSISNASKVKCFHFFFNISDCRLEWFQNVGSCDVMDFVWRLYNGFLDVFESIEFCLNSLLCVWGFWWLEVLFGVCGGILASIHKKCRVASACIKVLQYVEMYWRFFNSIPHYNF